MARPSPRWLFAALCALVMLGAPARAKDPIQITFFSPNQLIRGKATTVEVQGKGLEQVTAVEVTPPEGIAVEPPAAAESSKKKEYRWKLSLTVAPEAAPGKRTLVLVTPGGRSGPLNVTVPDHVPEISNIRIELVKRSPVIVGFTVDVQDAQGDLADMPMTYCQLVCKTASSVVYGGGVVTQRWGDTSVQVGYAYQDYQARVSEGACVLAVRVADKNGNSSEWLTAPVKF